MDPANNNMGARLLNHVNNVGANVINRANDPWRVGSIITSTTSRINRAFNTFTGLTNNWFTVRVILVVLILVGIMSYMIYITTDGFQSGNRGNSNQRRRKLSR